MDIPTVNKIFRAIETLEVGLNVVGYIPGIGSASATVRGYLGGSELSIGLIGLIFCVGQQIQTGKMNKDVLSCSAVVVGHGVLNLSRLIIEAIPLVPLATCLPYDLTLRHAVKKVFPYPTLVEG